jgi:predicted dehydrogenase
MEDLVGKVDAILLARDDSENHYEMALPFLRAGLPVYVDKPFAPTKAEAHRIFDEEQYPGQLYSCSALRFSGNLRTQAELQEEVGELRYIRGVSPSKWKTYSPHIVEPVLDLLGFPQTPPEVHARPLSVGAALQVSWNGLPSVHWACLGDGVSPYPFSVEVFGTKGSRRMDLNDYFHSFKRALEVFAVSVRDRGVGIPKEQTLQVIEFVERGAS